jgi:hypothetical protein
MKSEGPSNQRSPTIFPSTLDRFCDQIDKVFTRKHLETTTDVDVKLALQDESRQVTQKYGLERASLSSVEREELTEVLIKLAKKSSVSGEKDKF